ncbi:hypothetical protein CJ030_MR3G015848 [Morella rubra]|uniref:Uncharacterized protein n=1 Tax=Morella rubra TaxID=262757 RepID=A0A6A1W624_9ROSI|nr:hypothetical protein CJ030_MR3G015848 [Morella rubra]
MGEEGVVTPKKGGSDSEDGEEADTERTPRGNRTPLGEQTSISTPPLLIASSSRIPDASSHEPCLSELEASMAELKEEQKKMTANMRGLKHQVNNSIHVASTVIQNTVDEFKATSAALLTLVKKSAAEVVHATEVHMNAD